MGAKKLRVICDYCGKEFFRNPARLKYKYHFCSRHCSGSFKNGITRIQKNEIKKEEIIITKTCIICGKDISYRGNKSIHCKECQRYCINAVRRVRRKLEKKYPNCISCGGDIRERDGHAIYCYECARKRNIKCCTRYNKTHKEVHNRAQRKYYQKNKKEINKKMVIYQRERRRILKSRKYHKNYYKKNKEHILKRNKVWVKNNRDKVNVYQRNWYHTNIDHCKEYVRKYRKKQKEKIPVKICIEKTSLTVIPNKEYDGMLGKELIKNYRMIK